jgi:hypothetical protein
MTTNTTEKLTPVTFAPRTTFAVGKSPQSVSVVDANNDGKLDLITTSFYDNNISVLLGDGSGNFAQQTTFAAGNVVFSASAADVNGDGNADVITANGGSGNVSVLLGDGRGNFAQQTTFDVGSHPSFVNAADVNGDGKMDVVTANYNDKNISVLLGDGRGNFAPQTTFAVGTNPNSVSVADVNNDSKPDLITTNQASKNVSVLLGDGRGNFAPQIIFEVGSYPSSVNVADVNSDGNADVITANSGSDNVSVLLGDGRGNFAPQTTFFVNPNSTPNSVSVADVNNDSKPDLITTNQASKNVSVLLGDGRGNFVPQITFNEDDSFSSSVRAADVNGDDKLDLIMVNQESNEISVLLNKTAQPADNNPPTGNVTITGNTEQNETLTASNTLADADGLGTISYQWLNDDVAIKDATQNTYALTQADVGKKISVTASYVDGLGNAESVTSDGLGIVNVNDLPTGSVVITGDAQQGKTLTASNTLADLDGLGTISYQWLSDDTVITGANQTSYTLTAADVKKAISVKASYTDLQNTAESVTSTKTPLVTSNASPKPTNGDDKLIGTAKNDTLNGGLGFDELTGGTGADKFVYKSIKDAPVSHSKIEVITDFSSSEKDKVDLSKIDADTSKAKDQAFSKPEMGAEFSGVFTKAGQLFFDTTSHILYGNVNADETADFAIQLNGVTSLVAADFIL